MNKDILKSISILYVEDEEDVKSFTARLLENLVKKVYVASNGQEGLDIYLNNSDKIDLILTDINMPQMSGLEMSEKIKEHNKDKPIVITSAHNDPDFLKKAIDIGINSYAVKPIDLYQLIDSVTKAIEPIILKRKISTLSASIEQKVEKEISNLKSILDAQNNIVVVTKDRSIINANKKFLEFFDIGCLETYVSNNIDIFELFDSSFGFIRKNKMDTLDDWFTYISDLSEIDKVVKLKTLTEEERVFALNLSKYDSKNDYYVFSLTDITEIKERTNLLEYQASHDKLTGLYNRNKFEEVYPKEFRRDKRYQNELSVIMFDVDNFKKVNDTHGHLIGDEVLREMAIHLLKNIREQDLPVRWGGEEFLVLLPETSISGAKIVAEKLREVFDTNVFSRLNLKVTASFGVAKMQDFDENDEMILKADKALYFSKRSGKNRVTIYEE